MISMNSKAPTSPEMTKYKYCKNRMKNMTDAMAKIAAAGQYAQLLRERYENHVRTQIKRGTAHRSIAELPKIGCKAVETC